MAATKAAQNKKIRQDALREWLSNKCTAQHLVDNLEKIEEQARSDEPNMNKVNAYKVANDQRLRILNKYLPDLSNVTLEGNDDNPLSASIKVVYT